MDHHCVERPLSGIGKHPEFGEFTLYDAFCMYFINQDNFSAKLIDEMDISIRGLQSRLQSTTNHIEGRIVLRIITNFRQKLF